MLRPGEPYFLQFTPLLQEVDSLLSRLLRAPNLRLKRLADALRAQLPRLQTRNRGEDAPRNPLAALLDENRGNEWVILTGALENGEPIGEEKGEPIGEPIGETGELEKKNEEKTDEKRNETDETPSISNETPTPSTETPIEFEKELDSHWSHLRLHNRVSARPIISPALLRLLWDQARSLFDIPAGTESLLFRSDASQGVSQLLDRARGVSNTLLVVATRSGDVVGAFQSESWRYSAVFYHSGSSGDFRCRWREEGWAVEWFPWSKANSLCRASTENGIVVGVGNRHALLLSADLKNGASGECSTYRSPPLCDLSEFGCDVVELWTCK